MTLTTTDIEGVRIPDSKLAHEITRDWSGHGPAAALHHSSPGLHYFQERSPATASRADLRP